MPAIVVRMPRASILVHRTQPLIPLIRRRPPRLWIDLRKDASRLEARRAVGSPVVPVHPAYTRILGARFPGHASGEKEQFEGRFVRRVVCNPGILGSVAESISVHFGELSRS